MKKKQQLAFLFKNDLGVFITSNFETAVLNGDDGVLSLNRKSRRAALTFRRRILNDYKQENTQADWKKKEKRKEKRKTARLSRRLNRAS